jgi:HPt (histidine-containing phosphotransfer) domain-containing protein
MSRPQTSRWAKAIGEREALLGRDAVVRMAKIYLEELDNIIVAIIAALRAGDLSAARQASHHLSANAGSLDFMELADLAQRVEVCALSGDQAGALEALQSSVPIAQRSASELRNRFGIA